MKERVTVVTGERGAFVADTLHGDLTFYENGPVATEWDQVASFRGVTEGDSHPLRDRQARAAARRARELPRRRARAAAATSSPCARAWRPSRVAEACLQSARERRTVDVSEADRPMKIAVIGLGKIGLPARRAVRRPRPRGRRRRHQRRDRRDRQRRARAVPRRGPPRRLPRPPGAGRARCAPPPTTPRRSRTPTPSWSSCRCSSTTTGRPDFGWMDAATSDIGKHLTPDTLVIYETTLPVGTTRDRWKPLLEAEQRPASRARDFHLVFSPERVLTGRVFADLRKYPKLVGGLSDGGRQRPRRRSTSRCSTFDERPDLARGNGVWDLGSAEAAEMAKLAETTYRDVNIGLANQFARVRREGRHRRPPGDRGVQLPALQPHPPARHRRRRPLHPGLPAALPVRRPGRDGRARGPRGQRGDAGARRRPPRRSGSAT